MVKNPKSPRGDLGNRWGRAAHIYKPVREGSLRTDGESRRTRGRNQDFSPSRGCPVTGTEKALGGGNPQGGMNALEVPMDANGQGKEERFCEAVT